MFDPTRGNTSDIAETITMSGERCGPEEIAGSIREAKRSDPENAELLSLFSKEKGKRPPMVLNTTCAKDAFISAGDDPQATEEVQLAPTGNMCYNNTYPSPGGRGRERVFPKGVLAEVDQEKF